MNKPRAKQPDDGRERLHKRIAASGLCSRRAAEELISGGRVTVNGQVVVEMGVKVGPTDKVAVDGTALRSAKLDYVVMNKPRGVVTTMRDPQGRPTVASLLPDLPATLKPVGRLDQDTEGLLVFTNDGELANRLIHPRYGVEKEYLASVKGVIDERALEQLRSGVFIEGRKTRPAQVSVRSRDESSNTSKLCIVLHEGRKRQIRLMCEMVGHPVRELRRVRFGPLSLRKMPVGACRRLGVQEVAELKRLVGLS